MSRYLIAVWAGSGEQRWNPQTMGIRAGSPQDAMATVADCLGLSPEHWQGDNPPLDLVICETDSELEPWSPPRPDRSEGAESRRHSGEGVAGARMAVGLWVRFAEMLANLAVSPSGALARKV